ncbi:autotransporter outer membrane beta-barrel domain-containing protein [Chitinophaga niabensis]|uniref:autotransporter outer membrane beta-barrel domain-containing protein n=1 Tax=Chitinophaga niabensis TaxID=536979 RepID=UPI0031BB586D
MSKRNQNIEDWLRQAAAQDPEVSSDQLKQQAWGQLSNMLDGGEILPPPPGSFVSRWWMIIIEALILLGCFTYVVVTGEKQHTPLFAKEEHIISLNEKGSFFIKEQYSSDRDTALSGKEHYVPLFVKELDVFSSEKEQDVSPFLKEHTLSPFAKGQSSDAISFSAEKKHPLYSETTSSASHFKKESLSFQPTSKHKTADVTKGNKPKSASKTSSSSANRRQTNNHRPSTGAVYWNTDPLEKSPSGTEQKRLLYAGAGSKQTPEAIHPLTTRQLFVPVKDSGVQNKPVPKTPRPNRERREHAPYSLKIAAILPIADAYGASASIEYTFQWRKEWRIRPYIGAEHLTGFNRVYDHEAYTGASSGLGGYPGDPSNQMGFNKKDSVFTHFILNGLTYGKAGVQVAYVFSKWEIAAGVEYRYVLNALGKDTSFRVNIIGAPSSIELQPVLFNRKQTTGTGNVRLHLGLDYAINPRLQIGAIYYMQLNKQRLDSSYRAPHPKLPDQTSFQIHLRYQFRHKPPR